MNLAELQQMLDSSTGAISRVISGMAGQIMAQAQRIAELEAQLAAKESAE